MKLIFENWNGFLKEQMESTFEFAQELSKSGASDEQLDDMIDRLSHEDLSMLRTNLAAVGTDEAFEIQSRLVGKLNDKSYKDRSLYRGITLRKENQSLNEALLSSMEREELFNLISKLPEPVAKKMLNLYKSIESGAEKVFDPGPHSRSEEFRKKNTDPFTKVSRDLDISKFDDEIQKIKDKKY